MFWASSGRTLKPRHGQRCHFHLKRPPFQLRHASISRPSQYTRKTKCRDLHNPFPKLNSRQSLPTLILPQSPRRHRLNSSTHLQHQHRLRRTCLQPAPSRSFYRLHPKTSPSHWLPRKRRGKWWSSLRWTIKPKLWTILSQGTHRYQARSGEMNSMRKTCHQQKKGQSCSINY